MFRRSARVYDAIYAFRDYAGEAARLASRVRSVCPGAKLLLDVACGTGEHARRLVEDHGFEVDGLDLDDGLLDVARQKLPAARFHAADMRTFSLDERYDAILCLFSSIGYLVTLDGVRHALECFRAHLAADGVVLVEPWFEPGVLEHGRVTEHRGERGGLRVVRTSRVEVEGRVSRLFFDYRIEDADGVELASELHELGLFTRAEMKIAFDAAGLASAFDEHGLTGRGLWTARAPR
jgi:SAM-dependent methyltransferase